MSFTSAYWENNPNDGESQCQVEGPPSCVWGCDGICEWESHEDEDPIGFCNWLGDADASGCTSGCEGDDATEVDEYVEQCILCLSSGNPD